MKNQFYYILIVGFLFFSCRDVSHDRLIEIPVDLNSDFSLPLSLIADEIKAIALETTDESLINPDKIKSVHLFENHIYLHEQDKILVFRMDGKFIRSITSQGQGPGEFLILLKLAIDEKNKRLVIVDHAKIICYDLYGKFLFQSSTIFEKGKMVYDIIRVKDEILVLVDQMGAKDAKGSFSQPQVYKLNDDFQIIDSLTIRKTYYEKLSAYGYLSKDLIHNSNFNTYIYCPEHSWRLNRVTERVSLDTLYCFENFNLIPELRLKFKNNWLSDDDKFEIVGIYRSDRYIFAAYLNPVFFQFCYDTKKRKGYNMKNGFTDDIHQIEKRINIRPFARDTELFYYWHTHLNEIDINNEPNPTLYIGRLKK